MNTFKKKLFITICMMVFGVMFTMAQTQTTKHIVERGETIASIAQKYSVSKEDIVRLNPDAAQFVYVGMELNITITKIEDQKAITKEAAKQSGETITNSGHTTYSDISKYEDNDENRWKFCFEIGYGFLKKPEGVSGSSWEYKATLGATYMITPNLYAGVKMGYNSANYIHSESYKGGYIKETINCHLLCVPLEIGYMLTLNEEKTFGFTPFAGIDTNVGLSGKTKIKEYGMEEMNKKLKIGGKIGIGARVGIHINLWGFNVTGAYIFPVNSKQEKYFGEDAYPEVTIGFGF